MNPHFLTKTLVIMPAMNEEGAVAKVVKHWLDLGAAEVRVVDNGSTDSTAACAIAAGAAVIREPMPGYGSAAWAGSQDVPPNIEWLLSLQLMVAIILMKRLPQTFKKRLLPGPIL